MKTLLIWILAGGLLASLRVNLIQGRPSPGCDSGGCGPVEAECNIRPDELGLTPGQCVTLTALCGERSEGRRRTDRRIEEMLAKLRAQLTSPELDEDSLKQSVKEISRLREASLSACVEEVLLVRSVLDGPQIEKLMDSCCPEGSCTLLPDSSD